MVRENAWLGPNIWTAMSPKRGSNQDGCALKTKHTNSQSKFYIIPFDENPANKDETCELVNNEKDDQMGKLVNKRNGLLKKTVKQILLLAIESSIPGFTKCNIYRSIIQICKRKADTFSPTITTS